MILLCKTERRCNSDTASSFRRISIARLLQDSYASDRFVVILIGKSGRRICLRRIDRPLPSDEHTRTRSALQTDSVITCPVGHDIALLLHRNTGRSVFLANEEYIISAGSNPMAARASLVSASSPSCRVPFLNQRLNCIHRIVCRAIVLFNLIPFDFKIIADQNRSRSWLRRNPQ